MKTSSEPTAGVLHSLLQVCRDSVSGYRTAIADTPEPDLRRVLTQLSDERARIGKQLEDRLRLLREEPEARPTAAGAVHRTWMDLRAKNAANPTHAILAEIERGEALAVSAFIAALRSPDLDASTRRLVEHTYERVQAAHDRIRQLRDRGDIASAPGGNRPV